ncbi:MAG: ABC transporter ATP-binding protein [Helicobacteraceae bacterium]|nr:ABC transporter ATP-binding protein [Helicobacteraceae bacterium]
MKQPIITAINLNLGYNKDPLVIKNVNFTIYENDFVFITGVSGSGKSTLLRSMYGNLVIRDGQLNICGFNLFNSSKSNIYKLRRQIGIVFQDYKLIKDWNIEKNIMFPMTINKISKQFCKLKTERLLRHIRLEHKAKKYPLELSGGEQQRVALARALAGNPKIIFADEPTGNLDDYSSDLIWSLLKGVNEQLKITIVVVTHRMPDSLNMNYKHLYIEDGVVHEMA